MLSGLATLPKTSQVFSSKVIMGGNVKGVGNVTSTAEFNFHADPESARVVLQRSAGLCHTVVVPLDTCAENPVSLVRK